MRCVITGSEGFLGANLCRLLLARGHEVVGTSLHRRQQTSLDALGLTCRVEYGDVTDSAFVARVIARQEPDCVFHLAAVSVVRVAQAAPATAFATNVLGTLNVLEACRQSPRKPTVVIASSDKAYGDHGGRAYVETMALLPTAPYETSKAAADLTGQCYARTYNMNVKIARCANLYGPGDLNWTRIVPNSCRLSLCGRPPVVHEGVQNMRREYLHVEDAAAAYIRLAECGAPGAYNIGSGQTATTLSVAETLARLLEGPAPVIERKAVAFAEIPAQELCTDKLRALGWTPGHHLASGLRETAYWYLAHLRQEVPVCVH